MLYSSLAALRATSASCRILAAAPMASIGPYVKHSNSVTVLRESLCSLEMRAWSLLTSYCMKPHTRILVDGKVSHSAPRPPNRLLTCPLVFTTLREAAIYLYMAHYQLFYQQNQMRGIVLWKSTNTAIPPYHMDTFGCCQSHVNQVLLQSRWNIFNYSKYRSMTRFLTHGVTQAKPTRLAATAE